jgi:hypothetical protein
MPHFLPDWLVAILVPNFDSWIALLLYWVPLMLNLVAYTIIGIRKYRRDLLEREQALSVRNYYYDPSIRLGDVLGSIFCTVTPIVNLGCAIFSSIPELFGRFAHVLNIPLVPKVKN